MVQSSGGTGKGGWGRDIDSYSDRLQDNEGCMEIKSTVFSKAGF